MAVAFLTPEQLKSFRPKHPFLIGIDSDGCVFDSMEIKHKECFCPAFINHFGLQAVSKYAREAWEFVNLYSTTRGFNRFKTVIRSLDLLAERHEVQKRQVEVPKLVSLREWIKRETKLGNPALKAEIEQNLDPELKQVLGWSLDVNAAVKKIVRNVPPFPYVRESLEKMKKNADIVVVSQTPTEALIREWQENRIDSCAEFICGQELGTKAEHLQMVSGGKYPKEHILMIGDAPGDLKAAQANEALFYPINPGSEEASWDRFFNEAVDRFFSGTYEGAFERERIKEFQSMLPEAPPWLK
jgi:phosphoglycolate phosphatase-like HAD superfamily hydrolase